MRIFIGLEEISGYYAALSNELAGRGHDVAFVGGRSNPFSYGSLPAQPLLISAFDWLQGVVRGTVPAGKSLRRICTLAWIFLHFPLFLYAAVRYEVFIFSFGKSFFPNGIDLRILRRMGKVIIVNVGHGSDARPPYIDGGRQSRCGRWPDLELVHNLSRGMRRRLLNIEEYAHHIIAAPLSSQFLTRPCVNWFSIGLPTPKIPSREEDGAGADHSHLRVVHAPSNPAVKGSALIRRIINELVSEGLPLTFSEVHGVKNSTVLDELQRCDFVVDQAYSDTPLAGLAVEAAAFGKPSVVGGYGFDHLRRICERDPTTYSACCHPSELKDTIRRLATDHRYRLQMGQAARQFVTECWGVKAMADRYVQLMKGTVPDSWYFDPRSVGYVCGGFAPLETLQERVRLYIEQFGLEGLCLSQRSDLEAEFLNFAGIRGADDEGERKPTTLIDVHHGDSHVQR